MTLIVGLGNPGKKYEKTRHNAGFVVVDKLREAWNFPDWKFDKKFNSEISSSEFKIKNLKLKILLAKPMTHMNNSGEVVQKFISFYKLTPEDIIVIHDDLDIELGKYKISEDSSSAGHRGVEDIIEKLGTKNFKRIRIGIEGEERRKNRDIPGDEFVLKNFIKSEIEIFDKVVEEIVPSLEKEL